MTDPHIHQRWRSFSASRAVDQLGNTLRAIKDEDGLTWKDVGRVLGKSEDRASDYASGLSEMPVSAFLLACREWNGRFANPTLGMIGQKLSPVEASSADDQQTLTKVLALAHLISVALANDGEIDDVELAGMDGVIDEAARGIDALRDRRRRLLKAVG